jgi:glycine oxidase
MNLNSSSRRPASVTIIGAGVAGSWHALMLRQAGFDVCLYERGDETGLGSTGYWAGGMLAPFCEGEAAEPVVTRLGLRSIDLWRAQTSVTQSNGTLVVAHRRDRADFERFARLTRGHARLDTDAIAELEPALAGRFDDALFFRDEAHVEPRKALPDLHRRLSEAGVAIRYATPCDPGDIERLSIDCRGIAASDPELRPVKGEMIVVETNDIALRRPVRLIHPRWPLYIIPRDDGRFMIGATTIEAADTHVSVRSALELLSMAYAMHPAFAEARIVEIGAGLRPAFPDNLPRISISGTRIAVNGLYRHGFLLAPALAELTTAYLTRGAIDNEVMRCA